MNRRYQIPGAVAAGLLLLSVRCACAEGEAAGAKPAKGGQTATPPASANREFTAGGATIRLGMSHAEALAQINQSKDTQWFVQELDSPPTAELLKLDTWTLGCRQTSGAAPVSKAVTLTFENGKLVKMAMGGK